MLNDKLLNRAHWMLKDIVVKPIQTGHTPSMKNINYYGGKIAFIKTDNLHANNIGVVFTDYLSESGNAVIERTALQPNDIITTIIGATEDIIARSALILPEHIPANINQNIAQIRVNNKIAFPEYVNAFLNSKYGRKYLQYFSRQTEQVNLNCQEIGLVVIPKFSKELQKAIKECTVKAYSLQQKANRLYTNSEQILLTYLNIKNYISGEQSFCVKNLSDSFNASGRLDAEYYQTKYDVIEKTFASYKFVGDCCDLFDANYVLNGFMEYKYIELSNIGLNGTIENVNAVLGADLPTRARRKVKEGQVIVSSIEGSLDSCAIITKEYDNALCSTGFYVLQSDSINSETLLVLFKSHPIQSLLKKRCSGTILTAISKEEFLNLPLPDIHLQLQMQIAEKIQTCFSLREESKRLLEMAKQAVEMAIETDERIALDWIESQRKFNCN